MRFRLRLPPRQQNRRVGELTTVPGTLQTPEAGSASEKPTPPRKQSIWVGDQSIAGRLSASDTASGASTTVRIRLPSDCSSAMTFSYSSAISESS